jgi:hypothetical protein
LLYPQVELAVLPLQLKFLILRLRRHPDLLYYNTPLSSLVEHHYYNPLLLLYKFLDLKRSLGSLNTSGGGLISQSGFLIHCFIRVEREPVI